MFIYFLLYLIEREKKVRLLRWLNRDVERKLRKHKFQTLHYMVHLSGIGVVLYILGKYVRVRNTFVAQPAVGSLLFAVCGEMKGVNRFNGRVRFKYLWILVFINLNWTLYLCISVDTMHLQCHGAVPFGSVDCVGPWFIKQCTNSAKQKQMKWRAILHLFTNYDDTEFLIFVLSFKYLRKLNYLVGN